MTGTRIAARSLGGDPSRTVAIGIAAVLLIYIVVVPLVFLAFGSINKGSPGKIGAFTLATYVDILSSARTYRIIGKTFLYAAGASVIGLVLGTVAVWLVQRTDILGRKICTILILFPLLVPPVLMTVAWALLLDPNIGLLNKAIMAVGVAQPLFDANTLLGMMWVRGIMDVPLVYLWLAPALAAMDPSLEEAGAMSRAGTARVIGTISLPLILPSLASVFLVAFVLAIEDLTVPIILGLPARETLLATEIYLAYARVPADIHTASVHSMVMLAFTMGLMLLYRRLTAHKERYAVVRGRAYRPTMLRLGRWRLPFSVLLWGLLAIIAGLPLFILVWTSLSPFLQVPSLAALPTLSLRWYSVLLQDPMALRGFSNTFVVALGVSVVTLALAFVIGWTVTRLPTRFARFLDYLSFAPMAIPGLVIGLSLIWLYVTLPVGVYGTLWILGIALVTRFLPYATRLTNAGFTQLHPELEEAAQTAHANWLRVMKTITGPLMAPTLIVAAIYIVILTFRELSAALMLVSYGNEPFSVVAYQFWEGGEAGKTAAYGVVSIAIMIVLVLLIQALGQRAHSRPGGGA